QPASSNTANRVAISVFIEIPGRGARTGRKPRDYAAACSVFQNPGSVGRASQRARGWPMMPGLRRHRGPEAMQYFHNPRCAKSRGALELLRGRGIEPEIVAYLETPPSPAELRELLRKLGLPARE